MTHGIGRRERWWTSGFALFGLVLCFLLPVGVIGAIDASFTRSVAVPHHRSAGQGSARPVADRSARMAHAEIAPPVRVHAERPLFPVLRRIGAPLGAPGIGLVLAVIVVFALAGASTDLPARTPLLARPPSRGPPFSC